MNSLSRYRVLTFDCYGTLIDWETGIWDALQPLLMRNACSRITREQGLMAFARLESAQQAATPDMRYPQLLACVHGQFAETGGLRTSAELDSAFGASLPHWPAFPDTADALRYLKSRYRLAILSNVDREGFAHSNRKLGVEFDLVCTAEDIGSYKPAAANFSYLLERLDSALGLRRTDVLHTAQSLYHDHVPAGAFGLAKAWIDRRQLAKSDNWGATARVAERPAVDFRFDSLGDMAAAVAAAAD